ncbi:ferric reductase like transmembrane component-domain-containing protein [Penicillium malachiteum]|nr:ferric reductase like transmembrane component-domain-containing protein [Penicillium malachiteum]
MRFTASVLAFLLAKYTFEGSVTISSSSGGSDSESHGSSSSSSSSSSSNGTSSSSSASASSSSAVQVTLHGRKRDFALKKRGHGGSSSVSTGSCNSTVDVTSMYASAKAWCSAKDFKAAIPYWQSLCEQNSLTLMSLTSIEAKVTDDYIDGLSTIDPDNNSTTTTGTIDEAVLLSRRYYHIAYKSYVNHDYAISKDKRFGWGLMG